MSVYFFDTSALLKRYIQEPGTNWVRQLTLQSQGHMLVVSQIVSVETVSALARRQRERRISSRQMRAAMLLLERHLHREYTIIPFSNEVEQVAKSLLITHPLRGFDSIQLASAIIANRSLIKGGLSGLTFLTSDKGLFRVVPNEGLQVDDPNNYP